MKSTDMKISPLLKGKAEYMKWQQSALQSKQASPVHLGGGDMMDEEDDEMMDEEEWTITWKSNHIYQYLS